MMTGRLRKRNAPGARLLLPVALLLVAGEGLPNRADALDRGKPAHRPLHVVVMDPLAKQLACDCVAGYAQRDYGRLEEFLQKKLGRPVEIAYVETLSAVQVAGQKEIDLVIGKFSVVQADARESKLPVRAIAMLSGKDGTITQTGLFIVRSSDAAKSVEDLEGYRILFGPEDSVEKRSAAFASLEALGIPLPKPIGSKSSCNAAALAVVERDADAAVVSSYAMPLLNGCGTIERGELKVIGTTDPVPFVGLFATDRVDAATAKELATALMAVRGDAALLAAMESKEGFVRLSVINGAGDHSPRVWNDWRGPKRSALTNDVPTALTPATQLLWSRTLTGTAMSGLAVADGCLVVADKDFEESRDIFRCLDADTARQLWQISYPASGDMDYTNSPRANPVVHDGHVYLLGAFGDLHCVRLTTGAVVWRKHLAKDFGTVRPLWGYCSTPLVAGDRLIVNPGAKEAAIVALDLHTGKILWRSPGDPPGYAGFILTELGGVRQIVGYDAASLGAWDPQTGKRLWRLVPKVEGDFNVATPVVSNGRLLVATRNNGTRLYGFDRDGRIRPEPLARNDDLKPDKSTPVAVDGMVFGNFRGLFCLDLENGLSTLWRSKKDHLTWYCSFIAGNGHVLVTSQTGKVSLVKADKQGFQPVAQLPLFNDVPETDRDVWSHPALVGNRFYIRNSLAVYCFLLRQKEN